ncbi:MAG: hypothetical protein IJ299_06250 [Oscillospiraceae bacterium]|nr:hypothetical protein [Oscillospiraceae bacterium]
MAALLCLSGCIPINRVLNEKQLQDMLVEQYPESIERDVQNEPTTFEIDSFKIVRRQTYKEEKKDIVDCKMLAHTDNYEAEFCYTLNLDYYDEGGWQLDDYYQTSADVLKAKTNTVPDNVIQAKMDKIKAAYGKCELVNENFDTETGILHHTYKVDCDSKYLTAKGNVTVDYKLDRYENVPGFIWWGEEKTDNVAQEWKLEKQYILNAPLRGALDAVFVEGDRMSGVAETISSSILVGEVVNNEMELSISNYTYMCKNGEVKSAIKGEERILLDVSGTNRETEVYFDSKSGSCIKIGFDIEIGLYAYIDLNYDYSEWERRIPYVTENDMLD